MSGRLLGIETELALRFTPVAGGARPGNDVIYSALTGAIGELVRTQPGESRGVEQGRIFTEAGASFCYESLPRAPEGGLVEAGTPECDSPIQLLCHQRAAEALLVAAVPGARQRLATQGYAGEIGLLKNCRDAEGHIYASQENYEAEIAHGAWLWVYRAALLLTAPFVVFQTAVVWVAVVVLLILSVVLLAVPVVAALLAIVVASVVPRWQRARLAERIVEMEWLPSGALLTAGAWIDRVLLFPGLWIAMLPVRLLAFRRQRRAMLGFLVSRPILSGAGTVGPDGRFGLSERGPAIRRVVRGSVAPEERAIFDTGNLIKDLFAPVRFRLRPYLQLFRARQRMQLGLGDSNMAQGAEYLKLGATALVLDMAEAGALDDAPLPADPIGALHQICADPSLKVEVAMKAGAPMSALALQREYLRRAREFVRKAPVASLEARQILELWGEALSALEADPGRLVGTLDWVSKRYLVEACGADAPHVVQKKIDLRYHELGDGYFARLQEAALARPLVTPAEIEEAMRTPPASTPARLRGELVRRLVGSPLPVRVSWESVRIGGPLRGNVIPLRPRRGRPEA